ncbi:MAG: cytochrome c biogenesis protein CcsA, partial [Acidobacteriota bacterium]
MSPSFLVDVGGSALPFALLTSIFAMTMSVVAAQQRSETILLAATRAVKATLGLMVLTAIGLWTAFLTDRFDLEYVASYSSRDLPWAYKIAALWGGQKGSLVLWALILAAYAALVARTNRGGEPVLHGMVGAVLMGILTFFLLLANFSTNPFERVAAAADGNGLNPLLQHPVMAIHPPMLYTGFVGMSVPYAFLMASLWLGRSDDR